jgi:hypothetical protein
MVETRCALSGLKNQKGKRSMDHFAGLDVSVKETSVCIVDETGRIVAVWSAFSDHLVSAGPIHEKTLTQWHAKLPTGRTHSERRDSGIDRFGHFAGLTASSQFGLAVANDRQRHWPAAQWELELTPRPFQAC